MCTCALRVAAGRKFYNLNMSYKQRGKIDSNGTHYVISGPESSSSLVVFVHGLGVYNFVWEHMEELFHLKAGYKTLSYDLVGRGFSHASEDDDYSLDVYTAQLHGVMEDHVSASQQYENVYMIAHSMGGIILSEYITKYYPSSPYQNKIKAISFVTPAGCMKLLCGSFKTLQYMLSSWTCCSCVTSCLESALTKPEGIEKGWMADFVDKECAAAKEAISHLHGLLYHSPDNGKKHFHATIQSLFKMPFTNHHDCISKLSTDPVFDPLKVQTIFAGKDVTIPCDSNQLAWSQLLKNKQNNMYYQDDVLDMAGHGCITEYAPQVFGMIYDFIQTQDKTKNDREGVREQDVNVKLPN